MVFHLHMEFQLHPRLAAGGFELGRVDGCRVLLKNQASFPWILIVPEVAGGIEDLHQLDERRYAEVVGLIRRVSLFVSDYFRPEKLNVGCIGNMVRQMHIHVVGRNSDDPAWPGTVWAYEGKSAYAPEVVEEIRVAAREYLGLDC
jgi:diadenosine tetraphosphate (Ap4A) HIT family hydrolase